MTVVISKTGDKRHEKVWVIQESKCNYILGYEIITRNGVKYLYMPEENYIPLDLLSEIIKISKNKTRHKGKIICTEKGVKIS